MWKRTWLLLSIACFQVAFASSGDRSSEFINCVSSCTDAGCPKTFPLALRITRWSCLDDCRYVCTHRVTDRDVQEGSHVQQFFGKWPFWRVFGMQEPASVAFSLLNLWAHAHGARQIRRALPSTHPMKHYYLSWAFISMNAWTWSAVFHTRDTSTTEKLDYFSAALAILYAFYYAVIRLFHLYTPQGGRLSGLHTPRSKEPPAKSALSVFCALLYLAHVSYLSLLPRFNYSYNIIFSLVVGILHNILWLSYALPSIPILQRFPHRPRSYRPPFIIKPALCVIATMLASGLELFDFPPWRRILDAHSFWHLATAPLTVYWYRFLLEDSLDPGWREQKL